MTTRTVICSTIWASLVLGAPPLAASATEAPKAAAQVADVVRVEMRVTVIAPGSVYLDKGATSGLQAGDRVRVTSTGGRVAEGTIRAVSKNTARVELDPASTNPEVGDLVEATIPRARVAKTATPPTGAAPDPNAPKPVPVPDHPAWAHPEENWAPNQPLLAPAFGLTPEERERRVRGRAWIQMQGTWDEQGATRRYYYGNLGADTTVENPFGQGGTFRVDASIYARTSDADGIDTSSSDSKLRVSRLTYEFGGTEGAPNHWQFGRFLPREFPEFGLVDGMDWNRRLSGGDMIGASVGAMPEPFSDLSSFDDLQATLYWRHALDEERRSSVGVGYQNTWHHGDQDRNLFLLDARISPSKSFLWRSTAWIDVYGSEDVIKDGVDLTEFQTSVSGQTTATTGLGATYSHRTIPELLRDEYSTFTAASIADNRLDRVSAYGWWNASNRARLDARADHWTDQDDSGSTIELGGSLRDTLWDAGEVRAAVFVADGTYSSGPGLRVNGSRSFGRAFASLGYEFIDYEQKDFSGEQRKLGQHALFFTLDVPVFGDWDLSVTGERRFGDEQDSYGLGVLLQTRF